MTKSLRQVETILEESETEVKFQQLINRQSVIQILEMYQSFKKLQWGILKRRIRNAFRISSKIWFFPSDALQVC